MWQADIMNTGDEACPRIKSVALVDGHSHARHEPPLPVQSVNPPLPVQSVNITKSSRVHIGPNIVSVTQNLHKTQVVRVRILGLSFGSPNKRTRVAALAICGFLVVSLLCMYLVFVAANNQPPHLDIGFRASWYLRRADWQAVDPQGIEFLDLPVSYVIISRIGYHYCNDRYMCIAHMLGLQRNHLLIGLHDISPNYLVSGNSLVFEGRGANVMGSMVRFWNDRVISIAFMGNYMENQADKEQFDHINVLLEVLVENGVLRQDYNLYAHCQIQPDIDYPGFNVIKKMDRFVHWNKDNSSGCLITP